MTNPFAREPKSGSSWLWQAGTGAVLLPLLALHIVANHFVVEGGLRNRADVVAYLRNPVVLLLELLFLVVVTTHALLGVRAIGLDLGLGDRAERRLTRVLTALGVVVVAYALGLTWAIIN